MAIPKYVDQWKLGRMPKPVADKFDALARRRFSRGGRLKNTGRTEALIRLLEWFIDQPEIVQQAVFDQLPDFVGQDIREQMVVALTDSIVRSYKPVRKDTSPKAG